MITAAGDRSSPPKKDVAAGDGGVFKPNRFSPVPVSDSKTVRPKNNISALIGGNQQKTGSN